MHVLPRVRQLHERFAEELVVIGVHAGKFTTERRTERITQACERLGVTHPVVNDRQFRMWREYAVQAWPTVALIDPEGYLVGVQPGEFDVEAMASAIEAVIARADERGTLKRGSAGALHARGVQGAGGTETVLRFPTRAIAVEDRLWVSDTGRGRVLECSYLAEEDRAVVEHVYDGFAEPRGLAGMGSDIFVADRAGHSVWRLRDGSRSRVAGTGAIAEYRIQPGAAATPLRSPWDLAAVGRQLVVAMAGSHQLWSLDPDAGQLELLAGAGPEDIRDGEAREAFLAQPTGVATGAQGIAFADCESSAVRVLEGAQGGRGEGGENAEGAEDVGGLDRVRTLVGTDLFKFGDRPGVGDEALLQHCEDVAITSEGLAVADTYNDRLKLVDPATRECVPWPGEAGEVGALREPGGVSLSGGRLLIADTGNHRLVRVDETGRLHEVTID